MKETNYKRTIEEYNKLLKRTEEVIETWLDMLGLRGLSNGTIEEIEFNESSIDFQYEDYIGSGEYDREYYSFPASYLWDKDWEKQAKKLAEEKRLKLAKLVEDEKKEDELKAQAARKKQYETLKKEFEVEKYDYDPSKRRV